MAAYTNIDDPSAYFQTALYTGNSGTLAVTNDGNSDLKPDLVWTKKRSDTSHHALVDSSRGATKQIYSNLDAAEETVSGVTAFNTDGFTLGSNGTANLNAATFVGWQWKANGGTTASNTDGDITSTVQANTDAGFSIVTYTGNTSNNQTVGHGLGAKPGVILIRNRTRAESWRLNHHAINNGTGMIIVNSTSAYNTTGTTLMNSAATSSVFNVSTDWSVNGNYPFVAWCWAEKQGYSKFGSYIGNSNADGPFIYLGFKPAFVMIKRTDAGTTYSSWAMFDNKRLGYNPTGGPQSLYANRDYAEGKRGQGSANSSEVRINMLSNGFKVKDGGSDEINDAGDTYIYMAFAENPLVTSTGVPTTAR